MKKRLLGRIVANLRDLSGDWGDWGQVFVLRPGDWGQVFVLRPGSPVNRFHQTLAKNQQGVDRLQKPKT